MNAQILLTLAAAQTSIFDQLKSVPKQTWINIGICLLTIIVIVKVWRVLRRINEFVPYIAAVIAAFLILMYWVYDRTEPRFLTPIVDKLAPFLPGKTTYGQTQRR